MVTEARATRWSTTRMTLSDPIGLHPAESPSRQMKIPESRCTIHHYDARRPSGAALVKNASARAPIAPAPERPDPGSWSDERLSVAWLGHATVLLNILGSWTLTDP